MRSGLEPRVSTDSWPGGSINGLADAPCDSETMKHAAMQITGNDTAECDVKRPTTDGNRWDDAVSLRPLRLGRALHLHSLLPQETQKNFTAPRVSRSHTLPFGFPPPVLTLLAQRRPYSVNKKARESGLSFFRSVFARLFRSPDGATDRGARPADALRKGFYGRCCMFCSVGFPLFQ